MGAKEDSDSEHTDVDSYTATLLPIFFDKIGSFMKKEMTSEVRSYGLTDAQAVYLIALKMQNGQTLVELSNFLDASKTNTSRAVKLLVEKGLAYDDRKSSNSRKYSIYLTAEGDALASRVMSNTEKKMDDLFSKIPRKNVIRMRNTLIQVLRNMDSDIDLYMASKYANPFYTYLHTLPFGEDLQVSILTKENKDR